VDLQVEPGITIIRNNKCKKQYGTITVKNKEQ
jgi:hypothetical protein